MSDKIYIYSLIDPRTEEIFYIGKSDNPDRRFIQHSKDEKNINKRLIFDELKKESLTPKVDIIEITNNSDWIEHEKYWIDYGRKEGWPLVNIANGGQGVTLHNRLDKSISLLNKILSNEDIAFIQENFTWQEKTNLIIFCALSMHYALRCRLEIMRLDAMSKTHHGELLECWIALSDADIFLDREISRFIKNPTIFKNEDDSRESGIILDNKYKEFLLSHSFIENFPPIFFENTRLL